jgi:hypothetical protein
MEFIRGKSVAFVCQSPILEGAGMGDEIDSFDFVYRTNLFCGDRAIDYGSRCDILAVAQDYFRFLEQSNVENIVHYDRLGSYAKNVKGRHTFFFNSRERLAIRRWCIDCFDADIIDATSGLIAWWLCYLHGASRVKMFGMTGYQNMDGEVVNHTDHKHYNDSYVDALGVREKNSAVDMPTYDCHNFAAQNLVFRILIAKRLVEIDNQSKLYFT